MAQLTLEELKAQNAADDKKKADDEAALKLKQKSEAEAEDDLEDENLNSAKTDSDDDDLDEDGDEWMRSDEQRSGSNAKFTDSDVANVRRKLKGKLQKEKDEKDVLAEENAALKAQLAGNSGGNTNQRPSAPVKMPMLSEFGYREADYQAAMRKWVQQEAAATHQNIAKETSQTEAQRRAYEQSQKSLDDHYARAGKLVEKANIEPEVYQKADTAVRNAVESVLPNGGDTITDGLIARLGEGSEKVIFFIGRNSAKQVELIESLRNDPSGISAAIMLGQLKTKLSTQNRDSGAPSPGSKVNGDGSGGVNVNKLKRKYESGDVQTRINIKRQAKKDGVDVSGW